MTSQPPRNVRQLWLRIADGMAILLILITLAITVEGLWSQPPPQALHELAPGIQLERSPQFGGMLHRVTIDLRSPAVNLELAPLVDSTAEFRLLWLPTLVRKSDWTVAVSGGNFSTMWGRYAVAGQVGRPDRTLICDGRTRQRRTDEALLWFDEHKTGHLEPASESSAAWTAARWGLGGDHLCVVDGITPLKPVRASDRRDRRTVVGLDRSGCTLTLVMFESATEQESAEWLAAAGVWRAMELGTAENAGVVIGGNHTASRHAAPQRFITHALGIRSASATPIPHTRQRSAGR